MKHHHYRDGNQVIRITSRCKPSLSTKPLRGTWFVREYDTKTDKWILPCFPEITLGTLNKLEYLGSTKYEG